MFDKWAVYLAFTVNEAACDDVLSPFSLPLHPSLRGQAFWPQCPMCSGGAIGRSLPKGGTSRWVLMAFTAGSPPGSLCHQVSSNIKKTHLPLGCTHISPLKEIRDSWLLIKLLAITLPPSFDGFPSMFFRFYMHSNNCTCFPGNLRTYM